MVLNRILPPRIPPINRALAPWVRRPSVGGVVRCCICHSNEVYHIGGLKDFWLCFKCRTRLRVQEEQK